MKSVLLCTALMLLPGCSDPAAPPPVKHPAVSKCLSPAPLLSGDAPEVIPDEYIVVYEDALVDAAAETRELTARYSFETSSAWSGRGVRGFAARLDSATVEALRCEPAVAYVEHEIVVHAG